MLRLRSSSNIQAAGRFLGRANRKFDSDAGTCHPRFDNSFAVRARVFFTFATFARIHGRSFNAARATA
jgi:hypothetical protein